MYKTSKKSNCCKAPLGVVCGEDLGTEGTCHFECEKCGKPCDLFVEDNKQDAKTLKNNEKRYN